MVPPFVTPHTICASWDVQETLFSYGPSILYLSSMQTYFYWFIAMWEKQFLARGFGIRNKLVTYYFSEIIERLEPPLT